MKQPKRSVRLHHRSTRSYTKAHDFEVGDRVIVTVAKRHYVGTVKKALLSSCLVDFGDARSPELADQLVNDVNRFPGDAYPEWHYTDLQRLAEDQA